MISKKRKPTTRATPREIEVLQLVIEGHPTKYIADKLCITEKTVKFHLTNSYKSLKVKGRAELIATFLKLSGVKLDAKSAVTLRYKEIDKSIPAAV